MYIILSLCFFDNFEMFYIFDSFKMFYIVDMFWRF